MVVLSHSLVLFIVQVQLKIRFRQMQITILFFTKPWLKQFKKDHEKSCKNKQPPIGIGHWLAGSGDVRCAVFKLSTEVHWLCLQLLALIFGWIFLVVERVIAAEGQVFASVTCLFKICQKSLFLSKTIDDWLLSDSGRCLKIQSKTLSIRLLRPKKKSQRSF